LGRTEMSNLRTIIVAAVAAVATDAIASACLSHVGGDGPDSVGWIGLILLFPTVLLVGASGLSHDMAVGPSGDMAFPLVGFIQFFLIFWAGIRLASFLVRRSRPNKHLQPTPR
jgi:hypothetical protein